MIQALGKPARFVLEENDESVCQRCNVGRPSASGEARPSDAGGIEIPEPIDLSGAQEAQSDLSGLEETHDFQHIGGPGGAHEVRRVAHGIQELRCSFGADDPILEKTYGCRGMGGLRQDKRKKRQAHADENELTIVHFTSGSDNHHLPRGGVHRTRC
jgi:hypothetical protein